MLSRSLFLVFLLVYSLQASEPGWQKLDNCTLIENKWKDGDSFHVKDHGKEYIFRLYFVDTPEVEAEFPERVAEQAKYFKISSSRLLKIGQEAADFTNKTLAGKSFTVWTLWEDARGESSMPRFFGIIKVGGHDLAELLVENGLARVYGKPTTLPDGITSKVFWKKLEQLEDKAKQEKKGAWGS